MVLEDGSGGPNLLFGWVIPVLLMDGLWSGRMMPVEVSTTYGSAGSAVGGRSMAVAPGAGVLLGGCLRGW